MAMRAWTIWATGAILAGSAAAKPPDLPGKPQVDGKVPGPLTQEHYQVEATPPRLLPSSVLEAKPIHGPATADAEVEEFVRSGDVPIRAVSFSPFTRTPTVRDQALAHLIKVRAAFAQAELHFDACEPDDARPWYQEVIRLAPSSRYARVAEERLRLGKVFPAGQTREPPLADGVTPAGFVPRTRIP